MSSSDFPPDNPPVPPNPGSYPPPPPNPGGYPPPQHGAQNPGAYPPPSAPNPGGYQQPQYGAPNPGAYPPPAAGGYQPAPQFGAPGNYPPGFTGNAQPGDLGIRFLARLLDGLLVGVVATIIGYVVGGNGTVAGVSTASLVTGLLSGLLTFGYFVAFEVTQGWTPAKKLLGLSVRGPNGAPRPDLQQSAIRNSFTLLQLIPCVGWILAPIAYIIIAVTISSSPTKQGKHDELAGGTQVVKDA